MNGVFSGLYNAKTSQYRWLELGLNVPGPGEFSTILEFEDRHGGIGFYGGRHEFDEPGGTKVVVCVYVGPAAEVTLTAPVSTGHGSARWSAHPQLRIAWVQRGAGGGRVEGHRHRHRRRWNGRRHRRGPVMVTRCGRGTRRACRGCAPPSPAR